MNLSTESRPGVAARAAGRTAQAAAARLQTPAVGLSESQRRRLCLQPHVEAELVKLEAQAAALRAWLYGEGR